MNYYIFIPITSTIINVFLFAYIYSLDRKNKINRSFLIYCIPVLAWFITETITWLPDLSDDALYILMKIHLISWIPLGYYFLKFVYALIDKKDDVFTRLIFIFSLTIIILTIFTELTLKGFNRHYWGTSDIQGILYIPAIMISSLLPVFYAIFLMIKEHRKTKDIMKKKQIFILILGILIPFPFLIAFAVVVTVILQIYSFPDFGSSAINVQVMFIFYAIVKYNFLQIGFTKKSHGIFSQINDSIIILDNFNNIVDINDQARVFFNLKSDSVKSLQINSIFPEEYSFNSDYLKKEIKFTVNNKERYAYVSQSIIIQNDIIIGKMIILTDITEIKKIESLLRKSEEKYRLIADTSTDVIWTTDMNLKYTYCSPSVYEMRGYTPEEVMEHDPDKTFNNEDLEKVIIILAGALEESNNKPDDSPISRKIFINAKHKNGSSIPVEVKTVLLRDKEGTPLAIHGITRDITDEKIAEEKLKAARDKARESDKLKSIFLANMSHEIRTPLNAILGFTDLLLHEIKENKEHIECLNTIKKSGNSLLELINDLLDLSKIESGKLEIESVPFSLKDLLDDIYSSNKIILSKKNATRVQLKINMPESIPEDIIGDPIRLKQILNNLISNSIKFTNEGYIELGVEIIDPILLKFYVKDTGIGIPPSKQQAIFKPFTQADSTTTRKYGGTGLGLTISKMLVELSDGWLDFKSNIDENHGTIFEFTYPYDSNKTIPYKTKIDSIKRTINKADKEKTIIVAEDNRENRNLFEKLLNKSGHKVLIAKNGREAVELFTSNNSIDLILMDIQMPKLDGISATKQIRKFEFKNKTKDSEKVFILAVTAAVMKEDINKYMNSGFNDLIKKPIEMENFFETIKKYLG